MKAGRWGDRYPDPCDHSNCSVMDGHSALVNDSDCALDYDPDCGPVDDPECGPVDDPEKPQAVLRSNSTGKLFEPFASCEAPSYSCRCYRLFIVRILLQRALAWQPRFPPRWLACSGLLFEFHRSG